MPEITRSIAIVSDALREHESCLVAYSGGVDSSVVALLASRTLEDASLAVLADSPLLAPGEKEAALAVAEQAGFDVMVIDHPGYKLDEVRYNTDKRCYMCKSALFEELRRIADEHGLATVCCGDNADDLSADRPGLAASREHDVFAPLAECGIDKTMVRRIARRLGLTNANLPSSSCLATRLPENQLITDDNLKRIAEAESKARLIFPSAKVRAHLE